MWFGKWIIFARNMCRSWRSKKRRVLFYTAFSFCILLIIRKMLSNQPLPENHQWCRMDTNVTWLIENITESMNTSQMKECNISMTIVTAFFDIGSFQKGKKLKFTSQLYYDWAVKFRLLLNPMVVYTDSVPFSDHIKNIRSKFQESTKVIIVKRNSFWAWNMVSEIKNLYSKKWYPKFHPNTVIPEYAAAQHAKYAVVSDAIKRNYFQTDFYSWIDIGYFRYLSDLNKHYVLFPPQGFNRNRIAANVAEGRPLKEPKLKEIFYKNMFWVGGGMFFGVADVLSNFTRQYQYAVRELLNRNLMSTDQQILYSMYSSEGRKFLKPTIELQLYHTVNDTMINGNSNEWFHLGYLCLKRVWYVSPPKPFQSQVSRYKNRTIS